MIYSVRNVTQCVSTCFKVLYLAEAADVSEMVRVKNYICCFKYMWYYCFIGGFAATCGRILVKRMLTENWRRGKGGWG